MKTKPVFTQHLENPRYKQRKSESDNALPSVNGQRAREQGAGFTVAVPCFNEEGNVTRLESVLLPEMEKIRAAHEILLIDDGSIDRTAREMEELQSRRQNSVRIIRHSRNLGLGESIKTAVREARGEYLILLDADLTFHPREIPRLIAKQRETNADCVIGSHLMKGGEASEIQWFRLFLNRAVNLLYILASGARIRSFSSMFRLYRVSSLKTLTLESPGFSLSAEILAKLVRQKEIIAEVPVTLSHRTIGTSKIRFLKETRNHLALLCKIVWWRFIT